MAGQLPYAMLDELFTADLVAGRLFWRERPLSHFTTEHGWKVFKAVFAGREALTGQNKNGSCHSKITVHGEVHHVQRARVIWAMEHGDWPSSAIGHRNLNPSDDRIANLVEWTRDQQSAFARRTSGRTGVKGVGATASGKFYATICHHGQQHHVGTFSTLEEARVARNAAALALHGAFARLTEAAHDVGKTS